MHGKAAPVRNGHLFGAAGHYRAGAGRLLRAGGDEQGALYRGHPRGDDRLGGVWQRHAVSLRVGRVRLHQPPL